MRRFGRAAMITITTARMRGGIMARASDTELEDPLGVAVAGGLLVSELLTLTPPRLSTPTSVYYTHTGGVRRRDLRRHSSHLWRSLLTLPSRPRYHRLGRDRFYNFAKWEGA